MRNNLVKTKSQSKYSLQRYVKFKVFKIKYDKEPFGENRFSLSLFTNEIIQINGNSRWVPGSHLVLFITTNFIQGQLETKTNTCVKFHDCTISSFRGVARRTTFSIMQQFILLKIQNGCLAAILFFRSLQILFRTISRPVPIHV